MSITEQNWIIVMFPKIQIDTVVSYFLLKNFGEEKFPGIEDCGLEFWTKLPEGETVENLEKRGYILIDLGGSKFDHHRLGPENRKYSSSHLVARYLGVDNREDLKRLLEYARRDDLEGRGIISSDPIDRAFGLSALLTNLNKTFSDNPKKVLDLVLPMLVGHYIEENRRYVQLPAEHRELSASGKLKTFDALHAGRKLKIIYVETDNHSLTGYLRSLAVGADMVIQRASSGHVNFVLRQRQNIRIHKLVAHVKFLEAKKNGIDLKLNDLKILEAPGRTQAIPHWYYDTRANTLQNGGISPDGVPPTSLTFEEIVDAVRKGLAITDTITQKPASRTDFKERRDRGVVIIE